jgi:hypothetical protein
MTRQNSFGFVFSLLERSDIIAAGREGGESFLVDATVIEDIDAQLLEERMLGIVAGLTDDCVFATVH